MRSNWIEANLTKHNKICLKIRFWRRSRPIKQLLGLMIVSQVACLPAAYADDTASSPIDWSLSLTSEIADNLDGGIDQGNASNNLARFELLFDTSKLLGLPAGSRFKLTAQGVRSDKITEDSAGDAQGVSNIEAPSRDQLYEVWYGQKIGDSWDVQVGLIPADDYFDVIDSGSLLINSSFGAQPIWSANTVAAIYPTAGVGAMATWHSGAWTDRAGVFQADPSDRSSAFKRGEVFMQELVYEGTGVYKFGLIASDPNGNNAEDLPPSSWSGYFSVDEPLGQADNAPHAFFRVGVSPKNDNAVRNDVQVGVLIPALFDARPDDQFSFGITRGSMRGEGSETTYEATYQFVLTPNISLQPDIQYIDKPSDRYPAATVAILRLDITI